jgi:Na+/melibiose symporter-like transporter
MRTRHKACLFIFTTGTIWGYNIVYSWLKKPIPPELQNNAHILCTVVSVVVMLVVVFALICFLNSVDEYTEAEQNYSAAKRRVYQNPNDSLARELMLDAGRDYYRVSHPVGTSPADEAFKRERDKNQSHKDLLKILKEIHYGG